MECFIVDTVYLSNSLPVLCVSSHMPPFYVLNMRGLGVWTHEICLSLYHFPKMYLALAADRGLKIIGAIQLKFEGVTHKVFFFPNIQSFFLSKPQTLTPSL